ncbi:MAG: Xaa-Pro peptidase family protein [Gemmatimonadota bacterium]|nr:Xaa-Pro peptidase family protein [Gemmatimonadota bacterium]
MKAPPSRSRAPESSALKPLPPGFHGDVRERLRARAEAEGLDGILLLGAGNVRYATGWHVSVNERPVGLWLPLGAKALLLVPLLELENAQAVPRIEVRTYEEFPGKRPPVLWMIEETNARKMAVDVLGAELLAPSRAMLDRLDLVDHARPERAVKHDAELTLIREAAGFADMVLERLLSAGPDIIRQGGTEADLMTDSTAHVGKILADTHGDAFQETKTKITASVHSGPRAALPHGAVTARRPQPGEPIIAGIGCSLGGYHAESGVTLVLGEIRPEQRRIMEAMAAAGAATVDALERGWRCDRVNEAALDALRGAGLGDAIRHRIGHGMGVEGHEAPWLAPGDDTPTAPGMVFSCEPGVYRPGLDGWRTIDTLVVGREGVEVASRFQRDHPLLTRVLPC